MELADRSERAAATFTPPSGSLGGKKHPEGLSNGSFLFMLRSLDALRHSKVERPMFDVGVRQCVNVEKRDPKSIPPASIGR